MNETNTVAYGQSFALETNARAQSSPNRARLPYVALRKVTPERAGKLAPELPAGKRLARVNLSAHTLPIVAATAEFALLAIATFEAGALYHKLAFDRFPYAPFYLLATLCLAALFVVPCGLARDYSLKRLLDPKLQFRSVLVHWHSAYSLFVFALFMTYATDFYSRGSIIAQYAAGLITIAMVRFVTIRLVMHGLRTGTLRGKRVVVIGEAALVGQTIRQLHSEGQGAEIVGVIRLAPETQRDRPTKSGRKPSARSRASKTWRDRARPTTW